MAMTESKKVSIVVPVYGTEKFLADCLDSILAQSYKNIEVVCVNDASKDNCAEILEKYAEEDNRIKVVTNKQNRGLFHARIIGSEAATGDYICFVDSDDRISLDWIRLLVKKAEAEGADMVIGNTVQEDSQGCFISNNCASLTFDRKSLCGEEVFAAFMEDAGLNFSWHTVWNKLYSMSLWRTAVPEYAPIDKHLIMTEDIAFSLVLFYHCKKLAFSNHDCYFYCRHDDASTSVSISLDRIKKNIDDLVRVFRFFEGFLKKYGVDKKYAEQYEEYKGRNFRIWCNVLKCRNLCKDKTFVSLMCDGFNKDKLEFSRPDDFYFLEIRTQWQDGYEKIKQAICDKDVKLVSFDVFDTLICRPFTTPSYLVELFEAKYAGFLVEHGIYSFKKKRTEAEDFCRRKVNMDNPNAEDCTITEIYDTFAELFGVDKAVCDTLRQYEINLDLSICKPRRAGCDLFELALAMGKKVVITSDIYYDKKTMQSLLEGNGITGYDCMFISSEERRLKASGNLFKCVLLHYPKLKPYEMLHIGDNWESDCVKSKAAGMFACHLPKAFDVLDNKFPNNYTGDVYIKNTVGEHTTASVRDAVEQLPVSACHGIVANKLFDRPFPAWNRELRYNADFFMMGYYLLGMEMLGLSNWIYDTAKINGYKKVVFLARDGYLPKAAYDAMCKGRRISDVPSDYFYISRRALLPLLILKRRDISVIQDFMSVHQHSAESVQKLFADYIKADKAYFAAVAANGLKPDDKFLSQKLFASYAAAANTVFDFEKLEKDYAPVQQKIKEIFANGTVAFDMGYSGRIQAALSEVVGRPVDVMFVHSNGFAAEVKAGASGFKIHSFFDYTPRVSSVIREYFYSELCASCTGYKMEKGVLVPLFDGTEYGGVEKYINGEVMRGAVDFVTDYCKIYGSYDFMFRIRNHEVALPFEVFINSIPQKDMYPFHLCTTEDVLYSNYDTDYMNATWNYFLRLNQPVSKPDAASEQAFAGAWHLVNTEEYRSLSKFKKALALFICDRKMFKAKLKNWRKLKKRK